MTGVYDMGYFNEDLSRTRRTGVLTAALTLALAGGLASTASAATNGPLDKPQPISRADSNTGGANGQCPGGAYCSTRDGSPSLNGNGGGQAVGKPAAGSVGRADNKNPPGQMPNGSDLNAGYECDTNHGIGRSNPAHTSCIPTSEQTPVVTVVKPRDTPEVTPVVTPPVTQVVRHPVTQVVKHPGTQVVRHPGTPVVPAVFPGSPAVTRPNVVSPAATNPAVVAPAVVAPAEATVNPLPTFVEAGHATTSGQLAVGGIAAFAAILAFGAGTVLRRRHGDA